MDQADSTKILEIYEEEQEKMTGGIKAQAATEDLLTEKSVKKSGSLFSSSLTCTSGVKLAPIR